jgi:dihydroorotase
MAERPREILGIHIPVINEGDKANLCIFDLNNPWIYEAGQVKSLSKNSPYLGATFDVKVLKTVV